MTEHVCRMEYADGPCTSKPEHVLHVRCSNPGCTLPPKDETLCSACLQLVLVRARVKCDKCSTGMIITDPPSPLKGYWEPHAPTEGNLSPEKLWSPS